MTFDDINCLKRIITYKSNLKGVQEALFHVIQRNEHGRETVERNTKPYY